MGLSKRETSGLLRGIGGLLFASGAIVLLARKSGHHEWSDFVHLLVVLVPTVVLYGLALGVFQRPHDGNARPWQSVLMVAAILLIPLALIEFFEWIGANTGEVPYGAVVFAITALLAAYATRRARVRYAALLAGLSSLGAWLLVWEKILTHPSTNTFRWLLVAAAVLLLLAAARLARARAIGASEVATAGGIAAVAAGVIGVIVGAFVGLIQSVANTIEGSGGQRSTRIAPRRSAITSSPRILTGPHASRLHIPSRTQIALDLPRRVQREHFTRPSPLHNLLVPHTSGLQSFGWDLYLLIASLALIWIASRARVRGLGYVGGIGLLAFLISVSAQITRLESGRALTTSIVGWPLALLVLGLVGLAASVIYAPDS